MQDLDEMCRTCGVTVLGADTLGATSGGTDWTWIMCKGIVCGPLPGLVLTALARAAADFASGVQEGWADAGR